MINATNSRSFALSAALALCLTTPALAHTGAGAIGGLYSGFMHPISGLDHLVAMVAVGLWGAVLGNPALWVLPITFPLVMALGGVAGVLGIPLPMTEIVIALSGIALGGVVAFNMRPPLWFAAALVAVFAIFHGYAHGRELPEAADAMAYGTGFVIATGLLHLCGILIGVLVRWPMGSHVIRLGGAVISAIGAWFLLSALGVAA